jgi:hypothetical protein
MYPQKQVYTMEQGQVKTVYTMVYNSLTQKLYHDTYQKTAIYTMEQQQVQVLRFPTNSIYHGIHHNIMVYTLA